MAAAAPGLSASANAYRPPVQVAVAGPPPGIAPPLPPPPPPPPPPVSGAGGGVAGVTPVMRAGSPEFVPKAFAGDGDGSGGGAVGGAGVSGAGGLGSAATVRVYDFFFLFFWGGGGGKVFSESILRYSNIILLESRVLRSPGGTFERLFFFPHERLINCYVRTPLLTSSCHKDKDGMCWV